MLEAIFALIGVAVGGLVQWLLSRNQMEAERQRLTLQLQTEWRNQHQLAWQQRFQDAVIELISAADPEIHKSVNKDLVVPLIHKVQICLNVTLPEHAKCNQALNAYAMAINGWTEQQGFNQLLDLQDDFFNSARDSLWLPGR